MPGEDFRERGVPEVDFPETGVPDFPERPRRSVGSSGTVPLFEHLNVDATSFFIRNGFHLQFFRMIKIFLDPVKISDRTQKNKSEVRAHPHQEEFFFGRQNKAKVERLNGNVSPAQRNCLSADQRASAEDTDNLFHVRHLHQDGSYENY